MTMPSTGALNMGGTSSPVSVAQELGLGLTTTISMNQADVRTLAGVGGSGTTWSMNSLYGKQNRKTLSYAFTTNTVNASLNVTTISGYSAGISDITVTVNAGVWLYSTGTGATGLSLSGGVTGDTVTLVNLGNIAGQGGAGGNGGPVGGNGRPGSGGGPALSLGFPTTINNTNGSAYIGGGGGGGGGNGGTSRTLGNAGTIGWGDGVPGAAKRVFPGSTSPGTTSQGGGWGAPGGTGAAGPPGTGGAGGGGGKAVNLNGNTVTWVSGNTTRVYGGIS